MRRSFVLFLLLSAGSMSHAGVVTDQYQIGYTSTAPLILGGSSRQALAQTFTPSISGRLSHISFVIDCAPGSPGRIGVSIHTVDAEGVPLDFSVGAAVRPAADLSELDWHIFYFTDVDLTAGDQYAIAVRASEEAQCVSYRGASDPGMFAYSGGEAFFHALPNPPGWIPVSPASDFSFYTYMFDGAPDEPNYCDFTDANGLPNDWLPAFVPVCGCLSDPGLRVNRCWFAFPDFTLWREMPLPFDQSAGKVDWYLTPFSNDLLGVGISEYDLNQNFFAEPVTFDGNLRAGKSHKERGTFQGVSDATEVKINFETSEGQGSVRFSTIIENPPN